ncbi:hypothetical protein [Lysinibacillus parviboronicapiens]|uniref:hypothetical protein n=1 Tax=Lysinibacillus parviboronicapiens TaxID=436516 RepID=UPI001F3451D1|nr:hypothetical protein [Lysinibacillus parviboronicapiens]
MVKIFIILVLLLALVPAIGFYTEAVAETIVLGETMDITADTLYEVLSNSYGQSRIYERNYLDI